MLSFLLLASAAIASEAFLPLNKSNAKGATARGATCLAAAAAAAAAVSSQQRVVETDLNDNMLSSYTIAIHDVQEDDRLLAEELQACNRFVIDPHWHTAPWFDNADVDAVVQEMQLNSISQCLLYNPYPKLSSPFGVNTYVHSIASRSAGQVYMLESLNTTHAVWDDHREAEMERLRTFLQKSEVLGTKLAPPHTCLKLHGPILDDIMTVISQSDTKVLATHIGTTAFCGPLGKQFGVECNCGRDNVDPTFLEPHIRAQPDVSFGLLHSGHDSCLMTMKTAIITILKWLTSALPWHNNIPMFT